MHTHSVPVTHGDHPLTDFAKPFRVVARTKNTGRTRDRYSDYVWLQNDDGVALRTPTDASTADTLEQHSGKINFTITIG